LCIKVNFRSTGIHLIVDFLLFALNYNGNPSMALATNGESVVSKVIDKVLDTTTSKIIDKVLDTAISFLQENLLPAGDTEAELERLEDALPQIKAVLEAVDNNQINTQNKALNTWLWRLRDAVECADDVLDELTYYELEEKVHAQNEQVSSSLLGYKRKFVSYVRRKFRDDTLTRLVKAVRGLDRAVAGVSNFLNLEKQSRVFWGKHCDKEVKRVDDRETGSLLTESVVFGRDKERDLIVEWLTC
jgi:Rx N-terminal domain